MRSQILTVLLYNDDASRLVSCDHAMDMIESLWPSSVNMHACAAGTSSIQLYSHALEKEMFRHTAWITLILVHTARSPFSSVQFCIAEYNIIALIVYIPL